MKKNSYDDHSSKMNYLIEKIDKLKQNRTPIIPSIKHSKSLFQSKNSFSSRKNPLKNNLIYNQSNENLFQNNQIDIHTQALQTLTDAALNVKNLLSDFLVNADEDDKEKYNIEDELKQIKENSNKENLNIFSLIGNNSGRSSDSDNNNNKKNNNIK
jgi:hypothetical protein